MLPVATLFTLWLGLKRGQVKAMGSLFCLSSLFQQLLLPEPGALWLKSDHRMRAHSQVFPIPSSTPERVDLDRKSHIEIPCTLCMSLLEGG